MGLQEIYGICVGFHANRHFLPTVFLPFGISDKLGAMESESCCNATTEAAIREADDIIAGRVEAKRYRSFDELVADLDSGN